MSCLYVLLICLAYVTRPVSLTFLAYMIRRTPEGAVGKFLFWHRLFQQKRNRLRDKTLKGGGWVGSIESRLYSNLVSRRAGDWDGDEGWELQMWKGWAVAVVADKGREEAEHGRRGGRGRKGEEKRVCLEAGYHAVTGWLLLRESRAYEAGVN
jgi:hypothetical protein